MHNGSVFDFVGSMKPSRSIFNLSHSKKMTADMGLLYPVMCEEVVPGDIFKMSNRIVGRAFPLLAPAMVNLQFKTETYFVPYRILWNQWENFITKGKSGDDVIVQPTWAPVGDETEIGTLWDHLGFPTRTHSIPPVVQFTLPLLEENEPVDYPRRAYNKIFNEFYADETFDEPVAEDNTNLLRRRWKKDYFTSSLANQQRGTAPSVPISGIVHAIWSSDVSGQAIWNQATGTTDDLQFTQDVTTHLPADVNTVNTLNNNTVNIPANELENNDIDLGDALTFTPTDLRYAFQVQKWQERNSRAGIRYTEFLYSHFGETVRDDRLQRPEFIAATTQPFIVSEVLQNSESNTTPQGTLAGHGITADAGFIGSYKVKEFGLIMTLLSIMPRADYGQGMPRSWTRRTTEEYYFPEFQALSEQGVLNRELYMANDEEDAKVFGYQGIYNEMRYKPNTIHGRLRTDLNYWHLARVFTETPTLNSNFLECDPDHRIFALEDYPPFVLEYVNIIRAIRPMPIVAEPGLIDHF